MSVVDSRHGEGPAKKLPALLYYWSIGDGLCGSWLPDPWQQRFDIANNLCLWQLGEYGLEVMKWI